MTIMHTSLVERAPAVRLQRQPQDASLPLVVPVLENAKILEAWENFEDLKIKLLNDSDFIDIRGDRFAKKSAFRKLAVAFGISCEIVREDRIAFENGIEAHLVTMKAISPNGRFMTACGSCHSNERKFTKPSDVRATAQTRATNRAIADLIGWSAPSAEEVVYEDHVRDEVVPPEASKPQSGAMEGMMTEKQRALLVNLINQQVIVPEERETALENMEGYTKKDASDAIKAFLDNAR